MDKQQAQTLMDQIGHRARVMIGAKQFAFGEQGLSFRIGRNAKGVTHVRINLNGLDLYDMEFLACRAGRNPSIKIKARHDNVYADMLNGIIEQETGMYTSLGTMGKENQL